MFARDPLNPNTASASSAGVPIAPLRFEPPGGDQRPAEAGHLGPPVGSRASSASTGVWTEVAWSVWRRCI